MNIIERLKTEKIAVHCDTEEKHKEFLKVLHDKGLSWNSGHSLIDYEFFNYECPINRTCYIVNQNSRVEYCEKEFYENRNYKIISYDEFIKEYNKENGVNEKQETNYEHYREKIENYKCDIYAYKQCYVLKELIGSNCAGKICGEDCFMECIKWLNSPYRATKPKIKLTQFEYDLIKTNNQPHTRTFNSFDTYRNMKEKGYFKDVNVEMTLEEILNSCEVVDD